MDCEVNTRKGYTNLDSLANTAHNSLIRDKDDQGFNPIVLHFNGHGQESYRAPLSGITGVLDLLLLLSDKSVSKFPQGDRILLFKKFCVKILA